MKCALHGRDPNWGRILQAAGQALPDADLSELGLYIEEVHVARGRRRGTPDDGGARLDEAMAAPEVDMRLGFPAGEGGRDLLLRPGHDM